MVLLRGTRRRPAPSPRWKEVGEGTQATHRRGYRAFAAGLGLTGLVATGLAVRALPHLPRGYVLFLVLALLGGFVVVRLRSGLLLSLQVPLAPVWLYGWPAAPPLFLLSLPALVLLHRTTFWRGLVYFGGGTVWSLLAGLAFQHVVPRFRPPWGELGGMALGGTVYAVGTVLTVAAGHYLATGRLDPLSPRGLLGTGGVVFLVAGPPSYLMVLATQNPSQPHLLTLAIWLLTAMALKGFLETREANTRLREALTELQQLSVTDPLTGLFNRRHFMEILEREMSRHGRYGQPFSLLLLDVRNLKHINDTRGHPAGDAVLCSVADALRGRLRRSDLAFRIGGDEFAVLLPHTDPQGAYRLALGLYDRLRAQDPLADVTIGVAGFPAHARDPTSLIAAADAALYRARAVGDPVGIVQSP
ncbi:MAG: GGDEF domain-containing protein [Armatimonadota bacterium]|nr:GGDEF domain-containing protein [Armatimonadota bacterium]MDR7444145.1 GGDEF domain-containing protein [Armatimonadota bacterium]MDR7569562.1 GGDEF domain-containing protein [Armatimonadota bacterium]MDR7613594.1 GGDEF domain-containing protein [Armatimonadota bacterium]